MACCGEVKSNEELLHWVCECRVTTVASQALIAPVSTSFFAAANFVWYVLSFTEQVVFFLVLPQHCLIATYLIGVILLYLNLV
jgi:hypothetical protein